nr:RsmE family RNA methyltransferase [Tissierella sp.]
MHRFFVDKEAIDNKKITIEGKDFNHIKNVLRMTIGEEVEVSSKGNVYLGEIKSILEASIIINILETRSRRSYNDIEITLFQGLAKGSKMDLIIQKGTEIGIKNFYGVSTHRTIVKINDEKKEKSRLKRWNAIAEEAAKQSKQRYIPEVKDIISFKEMLELLKADGAVIVPYEDEMNISIGEVLKKIKEENIKKINLIIGPEGGFEKYEVEAIKNVDGLVVSLGSKILRTETAGLVAATIIFYELSGLGVI